MKSVREDMLEQLAFFIGGWKVEVFHPDLKPSPILGEARFEWLEDKYVVQRMQIETPEFPSSTIIYDWDPSSGHYVQHYFDSRGVTRLYQMTLGQDVWRLWRKTADFSPLDFHQSFSGKIDETGNTIESSWEQSEDGTHWKHDFGMVFKRIMGNL